jgi:hypothetical protein
MLTKKLKFSLFIFFSFFIKHTIPSAKLSSNLINNQDDDDSGEEFFINEESNDQRESDDELKKAEYFVNTEKEDNNNVDEEYFLNKEDNNLKTIDEEDCFDCIPVDSPIEKSINKNKKEYLNSKFTSSLAKNKKLDLDGERSGFVPPTIVSKNLSGNAKGNINSNVSSPSVVSEPLSAQTNSSFAEKSDVDVNKLQNMSETELDSYLNNMNDDELNKLLSQLV